MKKAFRLATTALLLSALLLTTACSGKSASLVKSTYAQAHNLAAECVTYDEEQQPLKRFQIKSNDTLNRYVTVDLNEVKQFNTITLGESGESVTLFSIYASESIDENYTLLYQGDTIEDGRVCYVGDVAYRYLRIFITEFSGDFNVNQIGVYNMKSDSAQDLRVNAYIVVENVTQDTDFSMLDSVTDLIVFGMASFKADGSIVFGNDTADGEAAYAEKVKIIMDAVGDRDIRIVADIHLPYSDTNADINAMMGENLNTTVSNIRAFVEKYGFDGYDIDYEYPSNKKEWTLYNDFLRAVHEAMPDKILSIATAAWALKFDSDVIALIDRVELMLYDGFDTHGYHSTFPYTAQGIQTLLDAGFAKAQIDIGVPFYSRPVNRHGFWGTYSQFAERMGKYDNLVHYNGFDHDGNPMTAPQYLNSYQMIADKTAFAIDAGIGGMMIWHLTCDTAFDNELSLFRAMAQTKQSKAS